ncbi:protein-disulfide reductase DsbD family protein [Flavobacterium sp.]|uniref:protein-disulfide reductase DsbD family protein n=1 Tax=Flavobacterium sp. TaxID=239 RepID=UPI003526E5A5
MKKLFLLSCVFINFVAHSQLLDPVKWKTSINQKSNDEFELVMQATIDEHWHMFSQYTPDGGSLPSVFEYKNQAGNYKLIGKTIESQYQKVYNDIFEIDEYLFENKATFKQVIKVTNTSLKEVKVYVEYQACKEQCIQQDKTFTFTLPEIKKEGTVAPQKEVETPKKDESSEVKSITSPEISTDGKELIFESTVDTTKAENSSELTIDDSTKMTSSSSNEITSNKEEKRSLWGIFVLAFIGGFAALLMPCIFPMIPMTVSFFTKQSKTKAEGVRNAVIYGLSIIAIYVALGSVITAIFGAEALNELSTSVWFNVAFFVLLVVFALSFLGAFEIVLPSSWATKLDNQAGKGGVLGIIFMALALAVVSFSCTGPIVGTLLVEAAGKGGIAPIVGMFGFSLAIALPFMLFAMFPGWLNSLPKSGGWLNTVKVSLGFLELAFAFKFLSNADLVLQKHWLEREVFIAIWIAVFGAWALYLFGKYMLPHDYQKADKIGVGRLLMAILVSTFTFYMIPGLFGAPLKLLSGLTPPIHYAESQGGFGNNSIPNQVIPEHAHIGPHGLILFDDYEAGLAFAKKVNKPVMLDFTGDACANCRQMEDKVWSDNAILPILKEQLVIISLVCDRKIELPKKEQYISKTTGKEIVTIGNKWTDFQITRYKSNSQPLYVILDTEGKDLSEKPIANTNKEDYLEWLKASISKF